MKTRKQKTLKNIIRMCCLAGSLFAYSCGAYAEVIANNALPTNGQVLAGTVNNVSNAMLANGNNGVLNLNQTTNAAVIKWEKFDIGTNATVNISGPQNFSTLNYVANGGKMSEIYGTLNAQGGNVFLVNPNGVNITKAAQINVGSLYVSNANLDNASFANVKSQADLVSIVRAGKMTNAELMSLGNIVASNTVTFDGNRIVVDADRLHRYENGKDVGKMNADDITIISMVKSNVVFGRDVYDGTTVAAGTHSDSSYGGLQYTVVGKEGKQELNGYSGKNNENEKLANFISQKDYKDNVSTITDSITAKDGYMWVKSSEQLQAMNTNLAGNYALYQTIGAITTQTWVDDNDKNIIFNSDTMSANVTGLKPIGTDAKPFTGNFDGLGNSIMGLYILRPTTDNVGLFGVTDGSDANHGHNFVGNVDFIGGRIEGGNNVGTLVGHAHNTIISNVKNSASVTAEPVVGDNGSKNHGYNVGGVAGYVHNDVDFSIKDSSTNSEDDSQLFYDNHYLSNLQNSGTISGFENVGGLFGKVEHVSVNGETFNLGAVKGENYTDASGNIQYSHDVGGLFGNASNVTLGNNGESPVVIYNDMKISGGYNVGGVIGSGDRVNVSYVTNFGDVMAIGFTTEKYYYHNFSNQDTTTAEIDGVRVANVGGIIGKVTEGNFLNVKNNESTVQSVETMYNYGEVSDFRDRVEYSPYTEENYEEYVNVHELKNVIVNYYIAGNVGGIVGSATKTNISAAENRDSKIYGAHNVGGIAGYFCDGSSKNKAQVGEQYSIINSVNRGSEIYATGATTGDLSYKWTVEGRTEKVDVKDVNGNNVKVDKVFYYNVHTVNNIATEDVRRQNKGEVFVIGNAGGIAGYMYGDNVAINTSRNSGNVHTYRTDDIASELVNKEFFATKNFAANVGGVVGKVDRYTVQTLNSMMDIHQKVGESKHFTAAISESYNTGKIDGYRNIGGIAGMMYNAGISTSYNTGNILTAYQTDEKEHAVNIGGILGDGTEQSGGISNLYDVYNTGLIGDKDYAYGGRHIGGLAGRMTGSIKKSYNTGDIYNNYAVNGGLVGYLLGVNTSDAGIYDSFNTGNINVFRVEGPDKNMIGGLVGSIDLGIGDVTLNSVYNIGNIRVLIDGTANGGLVGNTEKWANQNSSYKLNIKNAYFAGNIYSTNADSHEIYGITSGKESSKILENVFYIQPADNSYGDELYTKIKETVTNKDGKVINNKQSVWLTSDNISSIFDNNIVPPEFKSEVSSGVSSGEGTYSKFDKGTWRWYEGTTPILNAFHNSLAKKDDVTGNLVFDEAKIQILPDGGKFDAIKKDDYSWQFGTAYDPNLLIFENADITVYDKIHNDDGSVAENADKVIFNENESLVVLGGKLSFESLNIKDDRFYAGIIYADNELAINDGIIKIGGSGKLYGSSVDVYSSNKIEMRGSIIATGTNGGTGDIKISGAKGIEAFGVIKSAREGEIITVAGVAKKYDASIALEMLAKDGNLKTNGKVSEKNTFIYSLGDVYAEKVISGATNGNITLDFSGVTMDEEGNQTLNTSTGGSVDIKYGVDGNGMLQTAGDLNITSNGSIYIDSDMSLAGNVNISTTDDMKGDFIFDISNVGLHGEDDYVVKNAFLEHFRGIDSDGEKYTLTFNNTNAKLMVDLWDEDTNGNPTFSANKYNPAGLNLANSALEKQGITADNLYTKMATVWITDYAELKGLQEEYTKAEKNGDIEKQKQILNYNYGLKNNIDASESAEAGQGFIAIGTKADGTADEYNGIFYGRKKVIVGLNTTSTIGDSNQAIMDVGLFGKLGADATVKYLNIYASEINGEHNVGAIAGTNNGGLIDNVKVWGSHIDIDKDTRADVAGHKYYAGGLVGINNMHEDDVSVGKYGIQNSEVAAVISNYSNITLGGMGGVAGINNGFIQNVAATSNISMTDATSESTGGIVGYNTGHISGVDSFGYLFGLNNMYLFDGFHQVQAGDTYSTADNVGGIAGYNAGRIEDAYNSTSIRGFNNVGGIIGCNAAGATVENVGNSGDSQGGQYVGGIVGHAEDLKDGEVSSISGARNNATVTGVYGIIDKTAESKRESEGKFIAGIVGYNGVDSVLQNITNDSSASIKGYSYVGGIAGRNESDINHNDGLVNNGEVRGVQYVGGIAGYNEGILENMGTNMELLINNDTLAKNLVDKGSLSYEYFGGVAGFNADDGVISSATNKGNIIAEDASYVGGIVGKNQGVMTEFNGNYGSVTGKDFVGGAIGENCVNLRDILDVLNTGVVLATNGGAGGIVAVNTGSITNASFRNEGRVIAVNTDSSGELQATGGVIGVNNGSISQSVLSNNNLVVGTKNVGGVIGYNAQATEEFSGKYNITETSIYNHAEGTVIGTENVGGVIGTNEIELFGGRDKADNYYKYQVYNNGDVRGTSAEIVNVGLQEGVITKAEQVTDDVVEKLITTVKEDIGTSVNIGGLVGVNSATGSITAAYNTGSVVGSSNVGGIVGKNEGTVSQVFTTLADGQEITGSTKGYIVGENVGTVSEAYSKDNTGYYYGIADNIGENNGTFVSSVTEKNNNIWKTYNTYDNINDSHAESMLKVFLTNASIQWFPDVSPVYDGKMHDIVLNPVNGDVGMLGIYYVEQGETDINRGMLLGMVFANSDAEAAHSLQDYFNTAEGSTALIEGMKALMYAGKYQDALFSHQINTSGQDDNPNNLGFNFGSSNEIFVKPASSGDEHDINKLFQSAPWYGGDRECVERERKAHIYIKDGGIRM